MLANHLADEYDCSDRTTVGNGRATGGVTTREETTMKRLMMLLPVLLIAAPIHAEDGYGYTCTLGGATRKIDVVYLQSGQEVPCEVRYTKGESVQVLWNAQRESGYCEKPSPKLTSPTWSAPGQKPSLRTIPTLTKSLSAPSQVSPGRRSDPRSNLMSPSSDMPDS